MLTIYHSNQLDILKSLIAVLVERDPITPIFEQEVILVQSPGMAQWLQMALAEHFSVAANLGFTLPASFIWQLFTRIFKDIPKESAFTKDAMTWKLMALLPKIEEQPIFEPIAHYLSEPVDVRKHYQLSARLADLYDQYLVYRPEWIKAWESGKSIPDLKGEDHWQAELWRRLVTYTQDLQQPHWHRANLFEQAIAKLSDLHQALDLPKRVFVCGIAALPPTYLAVLQALGKRIDVHLMVTNPCRWYWGDIKDHFWLASLLKRKRHYFSQKGESSFFKDPKQASWLFNALGELEQGHPLLASWGKLGRDYQFLLQELADAQQIDAFVDREFPHLLGTVQQDILDLNNPETLLSEGEVAVIHRQDRSLTFHICHSELREVEILQDHLLGLFADDQSITPRDVIVMVADIDHYTPYIQSVFGYTERDRYLPYSISDRKFAQLDPIVVAFLSILNLSESRFTAQEILALLEIPALSARFGFDEKKMAILNQWVSETGIRWGLDDEQMSELDLPVIGQNTWRFGLVRMLLGYAQRSDSGLYQGVLPFDESSGLIAELAGLLADFLDALTLWRQRLRQNYDLSQWQSLGHELLTQFFVSDEKSQELLLFIEQQWIDVLQVGIHSAYPHEIPVKVIRDCLSKQLDQSYISQRFLAGQINFCTLMPMRSIPFKVVCLLGMNDGVYPRVIPPLSIDLMALSRHRGDRSRRDDDRYLFLEALLSAEQQLYISYIGFDIKDNSERYPSILVAELQDYISQRCCAEGDEALSIEERQQNTLATLIFKHTRVPFDRRNYIHQGVYQSFARQWLPVAKAEHGRKRSAFSVKLENYPLTEIALDELIRFYRHPLRYFFQKRLGVYFSMESIELQQEEPFVVEALTRYQMNTSLLNALIDEKDAQETYQYAKGAGKLPYGAFAELSWQQQQQDMHVLAEKVVLEKGPTSSLEVNLHVGELTLQGWLHQVQQDGLLRWRPAKLSMVDGITLWIEHVVYCALGYENHSRMFGKDQSNWHFSPMSVAQANDFLQQLLKGYRHGLKYPLLLLPKSGQIWLDKAYDKNSGQLTEDSEILDKAYSALAQGLRPNRYLPSELDDPYVRRVMVTLTPALIRKVIRWTTYFLLPIYQYRQK